MSESVRRHRPRGHEEHGHATDLREVSRRRLWWATAIIFVFLVVEVAAGLVILTTGWMPADPLASILIGVLILWSGIGLLRRTLAILIQSTPAHLDFHEIQAALEANPHVAAVHDLHIWSVTSGFPVLTANVWLKPMCSEPACWQECLRDL